MGNSKSKRDLSGAPESGSAEVRRRENPNHAARPLSDPGVSYSVNVDPFSNNFSMRPKADGDLTGHRYGREINRVPTFHGQTAPLAERHRDFGLEAEPQADYYETRSPLGSGIRPTLDTYHRYLSQLVASRPEYEPLRTLDFSVLSSAVLDTLAQVYKGLSEQQDLAKTLADERRENERKVRGLEDERAEHLQQLRRRDQDIEALKEDIAILKGELRKRGYDARLHEESEDVSEWEPGSPRPNNLAAGRKGKESIYKPTPLTQALGALNEEKKRKVVERAESLRPVGQVKPEVKSPGFRMLSEGGDSNDAVRKLELAYEREKKENAVLRERLETSSGKGFHLKRRSIHPELLTEKYAELEMTALGNVMATLRQLLGHVDEHRQRQFLCSVMRTAASMSYRTVKQFRETVQSLLLDPVKLDVKSHVNGDIDNARNRDVIKNKAKQFEALREPGKMSALAARTLEASKVPEVLSQQINTYLENMADSINLSSLAQGVVDSLRSNHNESATPAVINHATFRQFLFDCCRLAWQMSVIEPAFYVTTEDDYRFDDRVHLAYQQDNVVTNAKIDYYIWPSLFNKKGGDVLQKGRVYLKS